jgi:hypothetical protein
MVGKRSQFYIQTNHTLLNLILVSHEDKFYMWTNQVLKIVLVIIFMFVGLILLCLGK